MELKVWVDGIQRIVTGVTDITNCQDVVFALAHATGKTGRFTLHERWRNNERILSPNENPLKVIAFKKPNNFFIVFVFFKKVLMKWGEYSSDVQFILQRSEQKFVHTDKHSTQQDKADFNMHHVRQSSVPLTSSSPFTSPNKDLYKRNATCEAKHDHLSLQSPTLTGEQCSYMIENNQEQLSTDKSSQDRNLCDKKPITVINNSPLNNMASKTIPPPYKLPPSPYGQNQIPKIDLNRMYEQKDSSLLQNFHYNDLLNLVKAQREKICLQQADLSKFDIEIMYLENKSREQVQHLDAIMQEVTKTDQSFRQGFEQLQTFQYVEEECELVKQQEKTLKSEIALLRSKLANCETELLQYKNKIRFLLEEIMLEQRNLPQMDDHQHIERQLIFEVERIQSEIDSVVHNTEKSNQVHAYNAQN